MKRLQKITKKAWVTMPLVVVMVAMIIMVPGLQTHAGGYNAQQAVAYAEQWSGSNRNPDYRSYSGADCMNYVSQCLRAGGLETGSDWQPYTASWVGCVSFVNAMRARGYQVIENPSADQIYPGNPVLFQWKGSSYEWSHATICVGYDGNGTPIVNGHTTDRVHVKWNYGASSARRMCTVLINDGKAPTTEAPTTEAPTTEAPTTEAPTTEAPATEAPATEAPATEEPTEEVATEPTEEVATEPTEEAATEPTEEAATEPTEEAATEPTEEAATEPTEEAATEPTESTVIAGNTDINVAIDNSTNNTFITFINNILGIEETQAEESDIQAEITTEAAYNTTGGSDNTDWCREEAQRRYDAGLQEGYEPVTVVEEQQETDTVQTEKQKDEVQTTDSVDTAITDAEDSADTDTTDAEDSADTKDTKNTVDSTDTEDSAEIENGIRLVTNVDENGRLKNLYLQIVLPVNGEKQVYMIQLI